MRGSCRHDGFAGADCCGRVLGAGLRWTSCRRRAFVDEFVMEQRRCSHGVSGGRMTVVAVDAGAAIVFGAVPASTKCGGGAFGWHQFGNDGSCEKWRLAQRCCRRLVPET